VSPSLIFEKDDLIYLRYIISYWGGVLRHKMLIVLELMQAYKLSAIICLYFKRKTGDKYEAY